MDNLGNLGHLPQKHPPYPLIHTIKTTLGTWVYTVCIGYYFRNKRHDMHSLAAKLMPTILEIQSHCQYYCLAVNC